MKNIIEKVAFFDFTGTLFDPFIKIKSILNDISKIKNYKYFKSEELEEIKKMPPLELLNEFSVPKTDIKQVVQEVLSILEHEIEEVPPIMGIENLILHLKNENYYLGILSSNTKNNIIKWLNAYNLNLFDNVISIPFQESKLTHLNCIKESLPKISEFIFISDEVKDLTQASEAGFTPYGVSWGFDSLSNLRSVSGVKILNNPNDFINMRTEKYQNNAVIF
jgi:phosphoglycolate phosphatase-like HAD superfamily hydrolase